MFMDPYFQKLFIQCLCFAGDTLNYCSLNGRDLFGEPQQHVCDKVEKSLSRSEHLKKHRRTGKKPHHCCSDCGKSFISQSGFIIHCDQCGKSFAASNTFNSIVRIHTGEKPYSWNQCGKSFARASPLNRHKITHSGEKEALLL